MYDFYPEWGPARHRDEEQQRPTRRARYWQPQPMQQQMARAGAPEARDADGDRPEDN
jgi:hypothetical protein